VTALDTPFARLLHARGLVPLPALQETLHAVRAARPDGGTLAARLVARGLLAPAVAEALLLELAALADTQHEAPPPAPVAWTPGSIMGDYRIVRRLGAGGMGTVYEAEHRPTGARRALKTISLSSEPELLQRFQREAELLARVDGHPNVVPVHSVFQAGGYQVLVMDLLAGGDLHGRLGAGPLPVAEVVALGIALARGLEHLHRHGVLHRDLKPHNVIFDGEGAPRLADFGLARAEGAISLTATGEVLGTPAYMSPEQARGDREAMGPATDVYGLGAVLFHALTGAPPFSGRSFFEVLGRVCDEAPPSARARRAEVSPALDDVVCRALAKRPEDRYPTARALEEALEAMRPPPRRVPWRRLLVGCAVALAAVAASVARRAQPPPPTPSVAAPWPAPGPGWQLAWSLERGPAPTLESPALWSDAAGREAAPLEGVLAGAPEALAAAYHGRAELRPGGRIRVDVDLPAALRGVSVEIGPWALGGRLPAGLSVSFAEDAARLTADDDRGALHGQVGAARWRRGRAAAQLRAHLLDEGRDASGGTVHSARVLLGVGHDRATPIMHSLSWQGRARGFTTARGVDLVQLQDSWVPVEIAPGAPEGERARANGETLRFSDGLFERPPPDGGATLVALETGAEFRRLVVEGEPLATDRPARALAPGSSRALRVAAAFELAAATGPPTVDGGPFVALGEGHDELRLELCGWRANLTLGDVVVASVAVLRSDVAPGPLAGWLALERHDDRLRCEGQVGDALLSLELPTPLPWRAGLAPSYGSSGRRARFVSAEVHAGPTNEARSQFDAAADDAGAIDAAGDTPRGRWRAGATRLMAVQRLPDGRKEREAARLAARAAALDLEAAAAGLEDELLRRDALARAIVARALAGEADPAGAVAVRLIERAGADGARAALDALVWRFGAPAMGQQLLAGLPFFTPSAQERDAAIRAAVLLFPAEGRTLLIQRGDVLARASPADALALFEQARAAGAPAHELDARVGDMLQRLERYPEAIVALRRATTQRPRDYYVRMLLANALRMTDEPVLALDMALQALAFNRGHAQLRELIGMLLPQTRLRAPGLTAAAHATLARLTTGETARRHVMEAQDRAMQLRRGGDREADLASFAIEQPAPGDRPTAVLARAALGDPAALEALPAAAGADPLVHALASLHPALAARVR
jgi:hypothetical protein